MDAFDMESTLKDISSELFPSEGSSVPSPQENLDSGQTQSAVENDNSPGLTAAQIKALPKSWKKEMEAHWNKFDPAVHDYVYEREANVMRGLQQYSDGHKRWDSLISPYKQILSQHPNVDPVQMLQALMNSHLQLAQAPSAAEKRSLASKLLKNYGLNIDATSEPNSELSALQEQLNALRSVVTASQRSQAETAYKESLGKVEKFGADPGNKYFEEVAGDIPRFLGKATNDLKEAYDLACFANPVVRQKMQADQLASATAGSPAKKPFPNLDGNGASTPRQQRKGSMDETIDSIVAKHYSQN